MSSPNDNFQIRDGQDNLFKMRSKDISIDADGSIQFSRHLATPFPVDYGGGGCYQLISKSGIMAAGLAAASPIYSFRWVLPSLIALVRRVRFQAWSLGTGFTAGLSTIDLYRATAWTVADSGGVTDTITYPNAAMRTAMPASQLSEVRHSSTATLTAGTRTLDAQPMDSATFSIGTGTNTLFNSSSGPSKLFERTGAEHPLVLGQNEGFVIRATVPATGTWSWTIATEWDEIPAQNY